MLVCLRCIVALLVGFVFASFCCLDDIPVPHRTPVVGPAAEVLHGPLQVPLEEEEEAHPLPGGLAWEVPHLLRRPGQRRPDARRLQRKRRRLALRAEGRKAAAEEVALQVATPQLGEDSEDVVGEAAREDGHGPVSLLEPPDVAWAALLV